MSVETFLLVVSHLRHLLESKYPTWKCAAPEMVLHAMAAVVGRHRFAGLSTRLHGCDCTVDEVVNFGLLRFHVQYLECPYVWLWLMSEQLLSRVQGLVSFSGDYAEIARLHRGGADVMLGSQAWQHWEEFNTRLLSLRSELRTLSPTMNWSELRNMHVPHAMPWREFHPNAYISHDGGDVLVMAQKLVRVQASHQYATRSGSLAATACIQHNTGSISVSGGLLTQLVQNAPGANCGDSFCALQCVGDGDGDGDGDDVVVHEVHQYKHTKDTMTLTLFKEERKKAASPRDFFVLFTTGPSHPDLKNQLPPRSALVDRSNAARYYGPFAARSFFMSAQWRPNIHTATREQLVEVDGIGDGKAEVILQAQANGVRFRDANHAQGMLKGIGLGTLNRLAYD